MKKHTMKKKEWIGHHYRIESDYAQRILLSPKNSSDRERLLQEGYSEISKIFDIYDPGGGETDYTNFVAALVKKCLDKGSRIFDLGCASGNLLHELAVQGYEIEGIDVSTELIKKARDKLGSLSKSSAITQSDFISYSPRKNLIVW